MYNYEPEAGENFYNFMTRIKKNLIESNSILAGVKFNGIDITVSYNSNVDDLGIIYNLKRKLLQKSY